MCREAYPAGNGAALVVVDAHHGEPWIDRPPGGQALAEVAGKLDAAVRRRHPGVERGADDVDGGMPEQRRPLRLHRRLRRRHGLAEDQVEERVWTLERLAKGR